MDHLPEQIRPGEYSAKENLQYVYANFQSPDKQAQLLIRDGDGASVTDPVALERLAATHDTLDDRAGGAVIYSDPAGNARILSPLSVMREVAATNESFNRTFSRADTDGDRVPDRNVTGVYDHLFEVAPGQAERVIYRTAEGSYDALRLQVFVQGTATTTEITEAMREVGDTYGGDDFQVVATGDPIVNEVIQNQLLDTVIQSLIVTLLAVIGFLMVVYRVTEGSALLGVVTLLPVALSVAWILGTMYLLSIPFNAVTGTITSLTIGLGVAYCIHMSERFGIELERRDNAWVAMRTSVTGTGGALLGSAATTAGGFGVLAFSILPPLEQFGIITAISIIYAFLGSVLVLPTLLTFWTKTVGPDADWSDPDARRPEESSTGGSDPDRQEPVAQGEAPVAEADDPATAAELSPTTGDGDPEPADAASPTESTDDGGPGDRHGSAPTGGSFEQGSDGIFPPQTEGETEVVDEDPGDSADLDPDEREDAVEGARTPDVEPEPRTDLDPSAGVANGTRPPGESPEGSARGRSDGGGGSEAPPGEFDSDADGESRGQPSTDGSEWASFGRPDGSDDPDPSATPESETHDSEGATGQAPESAASPDDRAGTPTDGTSSLAPAHGDHSPDRPALERSIAPREVRPGDLVTVSLLARGHRGRLVLTERVPGVAGRIESYDPEPLTRAKDGRTVYFAWDLPSPTDVGLTYTTRVPEGATAGERLAFEGTVETADGSREVEGDDTVLVVSDVVAELLDRETTTAETVATAGKYLRDGVIGAAGFERIYRRWLADQPAAERSPVRERGED